MKYRYGVDYTCINWYVYDRKTDLAVKDFRTREEARKYAKKRNKRR